MTEVFLYHYYFDGIDKPVIIQAADKAHARMLLPSVLESNDRLLGKTVEDIIAETVSSPVTGISHAEIDGIKHLWAAPGHGQNGWIPEENYNEWASIHFNDQPEDET